MEPTIVQGDLLEQAVFEQALNGALASAHVLG